MTSSFNLFYKNLYEKIFLNQKNDKIITPLLLDLNFPIEDEECQIIKEILKDKNQSEIEEFFALIKLFEKQKFKNYKYIDYFFFTHINENNYEDYIKRLQEIIRDFKQNCENIEKRNREILNLAIIEAKKYKNLTFALEGGLSVNRYKNVLREHKDIDFIHFNDNYFNIIQKEVSDTKITITFEIFKYNFTIYKNSIPSLNPSLPFDFTKPLI